MPVDPSEVSTGGDVTDRRHNLQLGRTLIDGGDAGVAIDTLARVILHEAGAAMNLDAVVGILIGEFGCHTLSQRGERVGETAELFRLLLLIDRKFAFFGDIVIDFVHIHKTACRHKAARATHRVWPSSPRESRLRRGIL